MFSKAAGNETAPISEWRSPDAPPSHMDMIERQFLAVTAGPRPLTLGRRVQVMAGGIRGRTAATKRGTVRTNPARNASTVTGGFLLSATNSRKHWTVCCG